LVKIKCQLVKIKCQLVQIKSLLVQIKCQLVQIKSLLVKMCRHPKNTPVESIAAKNLVKMSMTVGENVNEGAVDFSHAPRSQSVSPSESDHYNPSEPLGNKAQKALMMMTPSFS
jgi:hypothetical protein